MVSYFITGPFSCQCAALICLADLSRLHRRLSECSRATPLRWKALFAESEHLLGDDSLLMPVLLGGYSLLPFFVLPELGFPNVEHVRVGLVFDSLSAAKECLIVVAGSLSDADAENGFDDFGTSHFGVGPDRQLLVQSELALVIPSPNICVTLDGQGQ